MIRFFTAFLLLFSTALLLAQKPSFEGHSLKSDFEDSAELQFVFKDYDIYQIDISSFDKHVKNAGSTAELNLSLGEKYNWDISIEPRDIRRPDYLRRWATADGIQTMPPTENITFRGKEQTPGGGTVSLTIDEDILRGYVKKDGKMFYIEPLWYFIKGQPTDLFVVYDVADVNPRPDAKCGYNHMLDKTKEYLGDKLQDHDHDHGEEEAVKSVVCKEVEIAIASDWLMFDQFGSAGAVEAFETGTLSDVQANYDDEFADELLFFIVEFFTVTSSGGDPWTTSTNAGTLLNDFTNWGPGGFGAIHDVGALWTDRNFNGGTIGIAWLSSICTGNRYHCLEHFGGSSEQYRVLWAHELGHNFSCTHDASGSFTIMAPSVTTATAWSATSVNQVNAFVPTRTCLSACGGLLPPVAAFSANPTIGCAPMVVQFSDQSQFGPSDWLWTFPGGTPGTSTAQNPSVTYNTPGVYNVSLTVSNAAGSNTITETAFIEVNDVPQAGFTFNQVGLTVIFTNTSVDATSFQWDFGDGNTSTDTDPVHTYADDDFYNVTLTAFNDCGAATSFETVPVFTPPTASFIAGPTLGCAPLEVEFTSTSSPNTVAWFWEFEGGFPDQSNEENPVVTYPSPGVYDVTLTAINPAGEDVLTINDYITVGTVASPDFSYTVSGSTVSFMNESDNSVGVGALSFEWDFGDGNTSTEENPTHTYASNGTFNVILTVTNDCGSSVVAQPVTILLPPSAAFAAAQTVGCIPFSVTFDNLSSSNATTYLWTFPGGTPMSSTDFEPTIVYSDPGTYDVTLIAYNSAGQDSVTLEDYITVLPPAVPGFTSSVSGLTVSFNNTSSNATSYSWDFGDGQNSTDVNPTHTYADDGVYDVELTATNDCGSVTTTQTVTIVTAPTAAFSSNVTSGCEPLTVQFMNESTANATSFEWSFPGGDPSSSMDENPVVVYNAAGTYTVTLTVSNSAGSNSVTQTDYIIVNTVPTVGFTSTPSGNTVSFNNSSSNATSYSWDFGDGQNSTDVNPTHTYADDGVYEVELTATNDCGSVTTTEDVTIVTLPTAGFSSSMSVGCSPLTVSFTNQSSANAVSYEWDFPGGDPSSSTEENPTVTYNTPGSYTVTLTVTNAAGTATTTETNYVVVNTVPTPSFTSTTNVYTANFTNTTSDATSYSWDFGDGNMSTDENPTHTYADDGVYTVVLTATNDCGSTTFMEDVTITSFPQAGFTANATTGCVPFTVQFMDASSSNTTGWQWDFPGGDPASSTEQNPTVVYNTVGMYTVSLTATNALGENTITQTNYINVITTPMAGFSSSTTLLTANFNNSSSGATGYSWDFGDGNSSTDENPNHTYAADGTYEVTLTATNDCGSVTSTETVVVVSAPTASFSADATAGCVPFEVQFTNQSSANAVSYEWDFPGGDPATSTDENPLVTYNEAGTYAVSLVVTNSAGQDETMEMDYITVGDLPSVSFTLDINGFDVDFNNSSTNPPNSGTMTYSWDFGDGNMSDEESPQHTYGADGVYEVAFTVTNDCGSKTTNGQVTIVSAPTAGFSADQTAGCTPFIVNFSNESSENAVSFEWEFPGGDPATSTSENPVVTYNAPGTYDVVLTVTNSAGTDMTTEMGYVTVQTTPSPGFDFNVAGSDVDFSNTSNNFTSVEWDFGDGVMSDENDPNHTYEEDGAYMVTLTATNNCGSTTFTDLIVIATEGPVAAFTVQSQVGCLPYEVTFENLSLGNAENYEWEFPGGDPSTSTDENPTVTYAAEGSYTVTLIASNGVGSDTFEVVDYIVVNGLPSPSFDADPVWETVTFTNNSNNATSYSWDFGDGNASMEENPIHEYEMAGEYEVTLTAENDCGFTSSTQTVIIMANSVGELPGISEFNVWPNPNNGRFTMTLRGVAQDELQVYFTNVLGQVILNSQLDFRSGNITKEFSFDGLSAGVYIFQLRSGNKALYKKVVID